MNIIIREIKANIKSLIYWSLGMAALVAMMFAEFSAYYKNPEMLKLLDAMPEEMLAAFGMAEANLTTVSGYVTVAIVFIYLALGIYALMLGNSIIAKEERGKTAGFLMALPAGRNGIITGKLISSAICCAILLSVVTGSILLSVLPYEVERDFPLYMLLVTISAYIIMLIFLSMGMFLAAITRRYKISGGVGVGLIFAMYIASVIAGLSERAEFLKYVTPFSYFDAAAILRELSFDTFYLALSFALIISALTATYLVYGKRDLYV